jgi:large subunit ribosomal protein L19
MDLLKAAEKEFRKDASYPDFKPGDTITVHYKIREGNKERIQQFRGVVLQRRGSGISESFTVRKLSGNIGVERIFPLASPFIEKIDINKTGHVRRARIFYLRGRTGKKARIQERRITGASENNGIETAPAENPESNDS